MPSAGVRPRPAGRRGRRPLRQRRPRSASHPLPERRTALTGPWYELSQRLVERAKADAERARLLDDLLDVLAGPPSPLLIEHGLVVLGLTHHSRHTQRNDSRSRRLIHHKQVRPVRLMWDRRLRRPPASARSAATGRRRAAGILGPGAVRRWVRVSLLNLSSTGQRFTGTRVVGRYPQKIGSAPLSR